MTRASEIAQRMQGPVCSVPTVFTRDGEIDIAGMRSVIDRALAAGSGVVMLTWGNSLISLLSDAEVAEVHSAVADHVADRALAIACDSMWGLPKCLEFGRYVRELGFDLYMVRPAEWARGTPQSLAAYYRAVARETPVMLVGDVPIRTCELISGSSGICAIKEDLSIDYAHEVLMRWGDRWPMVGGGGMQRHHPLWRHGHCRAWLDFFSSCFPEPAQTYWAALRRGDHRAAWASVMRWERPLRGFAAATSYGWDGLVRHALLEVYGVAPRWRRSPAPNPTDAEMDELRAFLHELGML